MDGVKFFIQTFIYRQYDFLNRDWSNKWNSWRLM